MVTPPTGTTGPVGKSSTPKRNNAARMFGYDVFISFALGPPPRGTHGYASDLARRLRERDLTVFFSEDEASPGEQLDSTLLKALHRSRTLVVIANRGTLEEPRWVRTEVEEFRSRHADRPIIPISIDGALQDATLAEQTRQWLAFQDKIWLDESHDAVAQGIASEDLVARLAMAPVGRSSNVKWRWVIRAVVAVLAVLTVAAIGFGIDARKQSKEAQRQQGIAEMNAAEAKHQQGVAEGNAAEAQRQQGIAEKNAAEASRQEGIAKQQARISTSRALGAASVLNKDSQLDLASLLSSEAIRIGDTFEARNAILSTFQANPRLLAYLPHRAFVNSVVFAQDGALLVSGGQDGYITFWDIATRQAVGEPVKGDAKSVNSITLSPDGKLLASGGSDGAVKLWDISTRKLVGKPLKDHTTSVNSVAFSPGDGKLLASAGSDGSIRIWDVASQESLGEPIQGGTDAISSIAFSPDGELLAAGSAGPVLLFQVSNGQLLKTSKQALVTGLAFTDGDTLATTSHVGGTIGLWDVRNLNSVGTLGDPRGSAAHNLCVTRDGKLLASANDDGTVQLWDMAARKPLPERLQGHRGSATSVAFSPDGKLLASAALDKAVLLWNIARDLPLVEHFPERIPAPKVLAFNPDGNLLASASFNDTVRRWNVSSRKRIGDAIRFEARGESNSSDRRYTSDSTSVAFSQNLKMIASGNREGSVVLWDLASQQRLGEPLKGDATSVNSVAFSRDGSLLASASSDGFVYLWSVASSLALRKPLGSHSGVRCVLFSPDGKLLASASEDGTVQLWDVRRRQPLGAPLKGSRWAASSFAVNDQLWNIAFSRDGKLLAAGGKDGTVRFWDVAKRQPVGEPLLGSLEISAVAFSPDSRMLVTGSIRSGVQLWDVADRQTLGEPFRTSVTSFAFSPDGKLLVWGSNDGYIWVSDVSPAFWLGRSCPLANRNLSIAEWQHYVGSDVPYHRTCPNLPPGQGAPGGTK